VQNLFTVLKVAGLAALVGLALVTRRGDVANFLPIAPGQVSMGLATAIGLSMISTLFAYDGWQFVSFMAGEVRDPGRTLPRAIILGVIIVIVIYVSANMAYIYVLGQPRIASAGRVAAEAMSAMIGPAGATLISLVILSSTFGALSANVLAGPRVFFAMGQDRLLSTALGTVHPRHQTPSTAIWALSIWAGLLTLTGGYEHLITMSAFANFIFFTMVVSAVIVLRRTQPDRPRPYRTAGYPYTVIVFVAVSTVFVINTLVGAPQSSLMGLGLLLLGVPFYFRERSSR
jgi:APA family basic amino acid/polyamine antiporter